MNLTRISLGNPVAVLVGVLLAILFGLISLDRLPVQLIPEVEKPQITIKTNWRAAAPEEIESEIIEPQESVFRGLPGMTRIQSRSRRGRGEVTLTFIVGMDMQRALLEVLNRLNRVPFYPEDAEEPVISSVGGDSRAIAWFIFKPVEGNDKPIASYHTFMEEVVQSRFERVPGVAMSEVRGGREREVRVTFDPYKAAALGVQLPQVARMVTGSKDTSAGHADVGKRRYTVRFAGKYDVDTLGDMVLEWREGKPVRLQDVARVEVTLADRTGFVVQNGGAAMAVNAHRENGVNVLKVMHGLQEAVKELQNGPLKRAGLKVEQVYDETTYIDRSVALVTGNLMAGVILAIGILWWFLRKFRATLLVALAIPVSIFTTFILLDAAGRTLNVISLAGLAFAVGMVLDAAIIVLENIVRLREKGEKADVAALLGTQQVWGALLASTITTVAIFLPVVFLREEAGQLFADLALTIAVAIVFSLIAAVTVLPAAARKWLANTEMQDPHVHWWENITHGIMHLTSTPRRRAGWIGGLILAPALLVSMFLPDADYLPQGNRNLVFAFILAPPGSNVDTLETEMADIVAARMQPYVDRKQSPEVLNYFFVVFNGGAFMGVRAVHPEDTEALLPLMRKALGGFPDTMAFPRRTSIFGRSDAESSIEIDIQGSNLHSLLDAAQTGFRAIQQELKVRPRPFPSLDLAEPELRMLPLERRIREVGWTRGDVASVTRAFGSGMYVGDYFDGTKRLDVILRSEGWENPEDLVALPVATPLASVVPLGELVRLQRTAGPQEIRRIDRRRTITLQFKPPKDMSLEQAIRVVRTNIAPQIEAVLPEDGQLSYSGTAEKLDQALASMGGTFLLAIVILYLIISALFRSFTDSLLVLLTIPLATTGGVVALSLTNLLVFQPMDLLTMIGFIILLGLVVNNAILLVHQTRTAEREGFSRTDAVAQAVRYRLRPILMSTLTSIFGMLPLLLVPGAGSELYRGLAAVIVGGMVLSTAFTLLLLPSLLRVGEEKVKTRPPVSI